MGQGLDVGRNDLLGGVRLPELLLMALPALIPGQIDINAPDAGARQALVAIEFEQRSFAVNMKNALQLTGREATIVLRDEFLHGLDQVAVSREPHRVPIPESLFVEVRDLSQGVILSSMRIAAAVSERLQLAKHRHGTGRSQRLFQLCQRGDALLFEKDAQGVGGKLGFGHRV